VARIGLIADTHDQVVPWDSVHPAIVHAFAGVELILHCGDLTTTAVLDRLEEIAPVVSVRSANDPLAEPPRLLDGPHVLERDGTTIGLVCVLGDDTTEALGRAVDVVVHGGTHVASIDQRGSVLLVNPGSPTLADERTVAILDLGESPLQARIVAL
jgi:uncharacterized protein